MKILSIVWYPCRYVTLKLTKLNTMEFYGTIYVIRWKREKCPGHTRVYKSTGDIRIWICYICWIGLTSTGWTGMGVSCRRVFHAGIKEIFECWMTRVAVRMLTETLLQRNIASSLPWLFGPNGPRDASSAWTATDGGAKRARAQLLSSFSTHRDKIRFISRTFGILLLRLSFSSLLTTNA